ncbi:hypothetical protein LZ575_03110 [Antarcticibacterium sp. 1MA-6-2]|uniref:hypothetical protein n=1 Tax=Antarcticibacterium sp. 1MA-6-2 TaxID=2908210 RepID=UPI001F3F1472|nr:hypothetical protein [Antarcticibacterium sp. 1MA-6-2]UJH91691.1 hypothetical protein LZ575_03110 [Antarcticibacterium sp. 1MA-6-2]
MSNAIKTSPVEGAQTACLEIEDLEKDFEQRKESSVEDKLSKAKLDPFEDIPEETPVLLINGIGAATLGNILTVTVKLNLKNQCSWHYGQQFF